MDWICWDSGNGLVGLGFAVLGAGCWADAAAASERRLRCFEATALDLPRKKNTERK
jgi:hypothetical protein